MVPSNPMTGTDTVTWCVLKDLGAKSAETEKLDAERARQRALDLGKVMPSSWVAEQAPSGESIYVNKLTGESQYDFPRESDAERIARKKRWRERLALQQPRPGSTRDVAAYRARLVAAGYGHGVIDVMIHARGHAVRLAKQKNTACCDHRPLVVTLCLHAWSAL
jgi:hypothetical protein